MDKTENSENIDIMAGCKVFSVNRVTGMHTLVTGEAKCFPSHIFTPFRVTG